MVPHTIGNCSAPFSYILLGADKGCRGGTGPGKGDQGVLFGLKHFCLILSQSYSSRDTTLTSNGDKTCRYENTAPPPSTTTTATPTKIKIYTQFRKLHMHYWPQHLPARNKLFRYIKYISVVYTLLRRCFGILQVLFTQKVEG